MYLFLIPLLLGFVFNSARACTAYYSRQFGGRGGRLVSIILRDVVGIPVWAIGYVLAAKASATTLFRHITIASAMGWLLILAGGARWTWLSDCQLIGSTCDGCRVLYPDSNHESHIKINLPTYRQRTTAL